jgi:hypothetical protein
VRDLLISPSEEMKKSKKGTAQNFEQNFFDEPFWKYEKLMEFLFSELSENCENRNWCR